MFGCCIEKYNRDFIGHHHVYQNKPLLLGSRWITEVRPLKRKWRPKPVDRRRLRRLEGNFLSVWQPGIWQKEKSAALVSQGNLFLVLYWYVCWKVIVIWSWFTDIEELSRLLADAHDAPEPLIWIFPSAT